MNINQFSTERQGNYTSLVYKMEPQESYDSLEKGMLENNRVDGILPISFTQMDDDRYLRYNISNLISLEDYIKGTVTKKTFLNIILSILNALETAEEYLINPSHLLIMEQYIYVNQADSKAMLVCLPTEGENVWNLTEFFRQIILRANYSSEEGNDYVLYLLRHFNGDGDSFNAKVFKEIVKALGKNLKEVEQSNTPAADRRPQSGNPVVPATDWKPQEEKRPKEKKAEEPVSDKNSKGRVSIPPVPGRKPQGGASVPPVPTKLNHTAGEELQAEKSKRGFWGKRKEKSDAVLNEKDKTPQVQPHMAPVNDDRTVVLFAEESQPTVVLGESMQQSAYLIRKSTNERINVTSNGLTIGRDSSQAQYVVSNNLAIGRCHARIVCNGGTYYFIDNNSKNFSFVDGTKVEGMRQAPLKNGSVIRLANEEFEFFV